ncbi:hypothetical protein [Nostoc sp. DSM 114161]|uniref:hypothetical protein n=1 Tax=Nostoc sp. DSM 114161 TaxID=3440143 RepID=UPI004045AE68
MKNFSGCYGSLVVVKRKISDRFHQEHSFSIKMSLGYEKFFMYAYFELRIGGDRLCTKRDRALVSRTLL